MRNWNSAKGWWNMYCKKCGNEIETTDAFCASCGVKIEHKEKEISKSSPSVKPVETQYQPMIPESKLETQVTVSRAPHSLDGYFDVEEVVTYEEEIDSTISRNLVFSIEKENEQEILDREYVGMNKEVSISNKTPLSNLNLDYDAFQPTKRVDKDPFIKKEVPQNLNLEPNPKPEPVVQSVFAAEKISEIEKKLEPKLGKKQVVYDMLEKELDSLENEVNSIAEKTPLEDNPTWKAFMEEDEVVEETALKNPTEEKGLEIEEIEKNNNGEKKQKIETNPVIPNMEEVKQEEEQPEKIMDKLMIVLLSVVAILSLLVLIFFIFQDQILSLFSTITLMVHVDSSILGSI